MSTLCSDYSAVRELCGVTTLSPMVKNTCVTFGSRQHLKEQLRIGEHSRLSVFPLQGDKQGIIVSQKILPNKLKRKSERDFWVTFRYFVSYSSGVLKFTWE
jgi:hypothetical protein